MTAQQLYNKVWYGALQIMALAYLQNIHFFFYQDSVTKNNHQILMKFYEFECISYTCPASSTVKPPRSIGDGMFGPC